MTVLTAIVAFMFLIAGCVLYTADLIMMRLGEDKVRIMTRVLGIILAALAVQFVLNGIAGFHASLAHRPAPIATAR